MPTRVQESSGSNAGTSVGVAFASNNTAANLLIACINSDTDDATLTSLTDTRGNTWVACSVPKVISSGSGKGTLVGIFYAKNCAAGANTVSAVCSGGAIYLHVMEYSGCDTVAPFNQHAEAAQFNGSATPTSPAVTTTAANELLIGFFLNNRSNITAGTGYTVVNTQVFNLFSGAEDRVAATAGSYVADSTVSTGASWAAAIATFKAAAGGNTPPTATITAPANGSSFASGATVNFTGTGSDAQDGTLAGTALAWSSSINGALGTGLSLSTSALSVGTHTITLTATDSGGLTGTASISISITSGGSSSGSINLTQLPVANRQVPLWSAYSAINVFGLAAGGSYLDPTTNVKVWKLTSATSPAANSNAMHPYSSGGTQITNPWGAGSDQYTLYVMVDGSAGYLIDFKRTTGLSNARLAPWSSDLRFTFSNVAGTPQKAYYLTAGAVLYSYNTSTGVSTLVKDFSVAVGGGQQLSYIQADNTDRYFVFMNQAGTTIYWWDSVTDSLKSVSEARIGAFRAGSQIDEPHFEKDGRYVAVKLMAYVNMGAPLGYCNGMIWDTTNDKLSDLSIGWSHSEGLNSIFFGANPNDGNEEIYVPAPVTVEGQASTGTRTVIATDSQFGAAENHRAGQWSQPYTGSGQYEFVSVDSPSGGRGGLAWTLVSGSIWQTAVSYQYQQAAVGVRDVLELNGAGTSVAARLTKVANVAAITGPGMWCLVGSTVSVWRNDSGQPDTAGKPMALEVTHLMHGGLGYVKGTFLDNRLLGHHYSFNPPGTYYSQPRATIGRDGRLAMFTSNMGTSGGRTDAFLAEVPLSVAAASALGVVSQPNDIVTGATHGIQPSFKIVDASGNTVTSDTSTVTVALITVSGTGTAIGTLTKVAAAGVAQFTGLGVNAPNGGAFKWRATDGTLTSVDSAVFFVASPSSREKRRRLAAAKNLRGI